MIPLNSQADEQLLSQMLTGDQLAFTALYNRYWDTAYNAAYKVLRDDETAMDVVQDVFVWLWQNKEKLEIKAFQPYLKAAVKFKVLNILRNGRFRDEVLKTFNAQEIGTASTDLSIEVKELMAIIDQFSEKLPDQARQIFYLSRKMHLSHKEIAEKLGISEKTVKNQINISLKKLKNELGRMSFWMFFFF